MFITDFYKHIKRFIQTHRHKIGKNLFAESLLKRKGLENQCHQIEFLALGSSHCARGFDADLIQNAYNLGNSNQDLYTSYQLLKKYLPMLKNLKHVVLFYAVFSPGHELAKTMAAKQVAINHYVFDIPYDVTYLPAWKKAARKRYKKFDDSTIDYKNFFGFSPGDDPNTTPLEERCAKHIRENQRPSHQTKYVKLMADLCQKNHIRFSVIICPCRPDYMQFILKNIPDPFAELKNLLKEQPYRKIQFLDWNTWQNFCNTDFSDADHVNSLGAKKLTQQLAQKLLLPLKKQ